MYPDFLPPAAAQLTEATSIAIAQNLQQQAIAVSFSPEPIRTSYVQRGTGEPPVLLLHGFDSSVLEFRRLLPLLSARCETWAIDLLGFGFTDRPAGLAFSAAQIREHLYHAWKTLIGRPVVLAGASMGGAAAIDFALTFPEAVSHLVLLDSAGAARGLNAGRFLVPPLGFLATEFLKNPRVRQGISKAAYCDSAFASADAACCAALHLQTPGWNRAMVAFTRSGGYNVLTDDQIAQVKQPTLILWGENDRILGVSEAPKLQQAIPQSKLIWIEQCGHVPHLEKPEDTAHHIFGFLQDAG